MSNFAFLTPEWPDLHDAASKAEAGVGSLDCHVSAR